MVNFFIRDLKGISTTCLTQYPESKTDRGVMKLHFREWLEDKNMYRLIYKGDRTEKSAIETWQEWRRRYATDL